MSRPSRRRRGRIRVLVSLCSLSFFDCNHAVVKTTKNRDTPSQVYPAGEGSLAVTVVTSLQAACDGAAPVQLAPVDTKHEVWLSLRRTPFHKYAHDLRFGSVAANARQNARHLNWRNRSKDYDLKPIYCHFAIACEGRTLPAPQMRSLPIGALGLKRAISIQLKLTEGDHNVMVHGQHFDAQILRRRRRPLQVLV